MSPGNRLLTSAAVLLGAALLSSVAPIDASAGNLGGIRPLAPPSAVAGAERAVLANNAQSAARNPGVLPPQSHPYGRSYAEWSVRWWQWAYGLPVDGHPLFDETGADVANGQSGPVWFLGGVFNVSGTATRHCTIPAGKALFFPIVNVEWDNFCPPTEPPMSVEDLRATAAWFMDLAQDLQCELDGRALNGLDGYRVVADPFGINMPSGNIWEYFGCSTPAGSYYPLVPDGFYVMLAPLSAGHHTLHFKGTIGDPVNFTPEVTYHLDVQPAGNFEVAGQSASGSASPAAPAPPRASWGRIKALYR